MPVHLAATSYSRCRLNLSQPCTAFFVAFSCTHHSDSWCPPRLLISYIHLTPPNLHLKKALTTKTARHGVATRVLVLANSAVSSVSLPRSTPADQHDVNQKAPIRGRRPPDVAQATQSFTNLPCLGGWRRLRPSITTDLIPARRSRHAI